MQNKIYLSTGTFTGKINNRDYKLLSAYKDRLLCDGFELMMYEDYYPNIDTIVREYKSEQINIPVVHAEKSIGVLLGGSYDDYKRVLELFDFNCNIASSLGAKSIVIHAWGYPRSDSRPELTIKRLRALIDIAKSYSVDLLVENVITIFGDSLDFIQLIHSSYPDLGFVIDTRHAQFHRQLAKTLQSSVMTNVRHFHIGEFSGGYKEWDKWSSNIKLGQGDIDWGFFFDSVRRLDYKHSFTIEASAIIANGVDTETLNTNLSFVRTGLT